jgi:PTS system beta-glucosides-specific IIC component
MLPFQIFSPLCGKIIDIKQVKDEAFSEEILGTGIAVIPDEGIVKAPFDAIIDTVHKHAIGLKSTESKVELLIHIGLETVSLKDKEGYFDLQVKENDKVKKGDVLLKFDIAKIREAGLDITSPVIITNTDDFKEIMKAYSKMFVSFGDLILTAE